MQVIRKDSVLLWRISSSRDQMGRTCGTYETEEKCVQDCGGKNWWKDVN